MRWLFALAALLVFSACASAPPKDAGPDVPGLTAAIRALSPDIDPAEAAAAAELSYATTRRLAVAYQITDPPLVHNAKVNAGIKPRGLCHHWAADLQQALEAAGFGTLEIKRAIANADNPILIDHSTAVITAPGAPMESGVVIDPWRNGGTLFWAPVVEDKRYDWERQEDVLRRKGLLFYRGANGELIPYPG